MFKEAVQESTQVDWIISSRTEIKYEAQNRIIKLSERIKSM